MTKVYRSRQLLLTRLGVVDKREYIGQVLSINYNGIVLARVLLIVLIVVSRWHCKSLIRVCVNTVHNDNPTLSFSTKTIISVFKKHKSKLFEECT